MDLYLSGLREGVEYETQATLKLVEGKTYRPDVIIHMPQNRDIVIDAKVSMGEHMQKAQDSYDIAMKRLKNGKGNIIKRAENMVELGLKPKKILSISSED